MSKILSSSKLVEAAASTLGNYLGPLIKVSLKDLNETARRSQKLAT